MNYYEIALPIKINRLFIYKSQREICKGYRVFVSFNNTFHTGIVWQKVRTIDSKIKYKNIIEVIDENPKIPKELLQLTEWISKYYQCSLGIALSAMLPSAFNVQTQLKIKKNNSELIDNKELREFLEVKSNKEWVDLKELKKQININALSKLLEELEQKNIIEIQRTFDLKIKKKIANYLILEDVKQLPEMTKKQKLIYKELKQIGNDFPLAKVAEKYTYYIIKKLRDLNLLKIVPREIKTFKNILPPKRTKFVVTLTDEQQQAVQKINSKLSQNIFCTFLIFGITGSGKTEVYIKAIQKTLHDGKTALMLVPEISLTPQMVERFFNAFGEDIAILHSHLNEREKWEQWNKIKSEKSKIVIGARSAIFAPLENIGIIIVDEEHETSYKQDTAPRYSGRDIAIVRAKFSNAVVLLGSATPSLESWKNASLGKYELLKLTERPFKIKLPKVQIIDMRIEEDTKQLLSTKLKSKMEKRLERNEQIILFHNRRGHSSFVQCISCGKLFKCNDCDISLNFHSRSQILLCHYCGKKKDMPRKCPDCGSYKFSFGAAGTQQIEKYLQIVFPNAKILRMDSDSARKKDSYDSMFERMKNGDIDILLGTQMIAKGLDFKNVTLVGVILADIGLNIPDFRAAERTFQLLTQVSGRSGRGEKSGEVIIQTFNPEHYSIQFAMEQNFEDFASKELKLRKELKYPPNYKIIRLIFSHKNEKLLREKIFQNRKTLDKLDTQIENDEIQILGPTQAPLVKIKNQFRYHIILKSKSVKTLSQAVNYLKQNMKLSSTIKQTIDVDPYSLL